MRVGGAHLRCVSWTAVSSEPQSEKESLHDQRRLNHEFIANIGRYYHGCTAEVVADLQVVGSRTIADVADAAAAYPDAYGELLRLLKSHSIDAVVCRSRDRLGRTDSLIVTIERICWQHNAVVVPRQSLPATLDVRDLRDSEGAGLITAIEAHFAGSAVRRINNEHAMGMAARVRHGRFAGKIPWGYKKVYDAGGKSRIEIDEAAAAALRYLLLDLYLAQGMGMASIAVRLDAEGYKSPSGRQWTLRSVRSIMQSLDRYAGYVYVNRRSPAGREPVRARSRHAAILSEDELAALQAEIERRVLPPRQERGLLRGVVLCTATGKPLHVVTQHGQVCYRCSHCHKVGQAHLVTEKKLLRILRAVIDQLAQSVEPLEVLAARQRPRIEALEAECAGLEKTLARLETKRKRLLHTYIYRDAMQEGAFDAEMEKISSEIAKAQMGMAEANRQLAGLRDLHAADQRVETIRAMGRQIMDEAGENQQRAREFFLAAFRVYVSAGDRTDTGARTKIDRVEIL